MKSQLFFLNIFLLLFLPLFGESPHLSILQEGSLVIYELPQSIVAVQVKKRASSEVLIEVTTATKDVVARENFSSWMAWCKAGMPSASSSEELALSLERGTLSQRGTSHIAWLYTLLTLDMTEVPLEERKKAGPPPMQGEQDLRRVWQPKVIVDGQKKNTESIAYKVIWPDDGSSFAKREMILYFPVTDEAVKGFPYWIESPSSSYKAFVVDSTQSFS